MKKYLFLILVLFFTSSTVIAEPSLHQTMLQTKQDIEQAIKELNGLQAKHLQEKIQLSKEISTLEKEVLPLREKADTLKTIAWQKETGFQQLNEELAYLRQEVDFCASILNEFRREMGSRLQAAEGQGLKNKLAELEKAFQQNDSLGILGQAERLLTFVEFHNLENVGGRIFAGKAVNQHGVFLQGQFVFLGPVQLFLSQDKQLAGQVGAGLETRHPAVMKIISSTMVQKIIQGQEAEIPIDMTTGDAVKIEQQKKSWLETVQSGGIVMIPILLLGILCIITAIWKFISLNKLQLDTHVSLAGIIALVNKKQTEPARQQALALGLPLGPVLAEGIEHAKAPREQLEEIMHEQILGQIPLLEKHLALLAVAAAVAPLLGLLGTVTGMVHTFDLVAVFGTGKVNILSGGISEALVTTEYGLIVAIPTLLVHAFLSRRVKRVIHLLEQNTLTFINGLRKNH